MATFLSNLPSFNKDNFSNFQPDLNRTQVKEEFKLTFTFILLALINFSNKSNEDNHLLHAIK